MMQISLRTKKVEPLHSLHVLEAESVEVVEPLHVSEGLVKAPEEHQLISPHHHAMAAAGGGGLARHIQLLPRVCLMGGG